uniref:U3 protein n=1 Tax=Hapavirus flanders TaxID=1972612 RepID=T2FGI6_9RHAB|nr:U3 protein [Hapavirus flanders]
MDCTFNLSAFFYLPDYLYKKPVIDRLEWEIISWMRENYNMSTELCALTTTFLMSQVYPLAKDQDVLYLCGELRANVSFFKKSKHNQYPGIKWISENPSFVLGDYVCKVSICGRVSLPGRPGGQTPWEIWYSSTRSKIPKEMRREIEDAAHSYHFEYLLDY